MNRREIINISNSLSFIRIFFAFPIYYYISQQQNVIVVLLAVIAYGTDLLDGFLARRLNQITAFGKMIDPLADKICIGAGLIALTLYQNFPLWITAVIISRDIILVAGSAVLLIMKKNVISSNKPGKYTVTFIVALAVIFLLHIKFLEWPLTIAAIIMLPYSLVKYGLIVYKMIIKPDAA
jgi:CDP-diacylglycerol--glycerol-3-phosphate 3-phosphatidyltransferase